MTGAAMKYAATQTDRALGIVKGQEYTLENGMLTRLMANGRTKFLLNANQIIRSGKVRRCSNL